MHIKAAEFIKTAELTGSALRVREALDALGLSDLQIVEFTIPTRTSAEAAEVVGCTVAQIAKSMVFRARTSHRLVLVVASGSNRVSERKVEALLASELSGERITRADPDFVRETTGFAIGGVAPVGHRTTPIVAIDKDLMDYESLWAAGGTPNTVFRLTPQQLLQAVVGRIGDVAMAV